MNLTEAEKALEPAIAALGERYRVQYPFLALKYFADFALLDRKIIVEVDGDSHNTPAQKEKDLQHALQVLELGWVIVRVTNEQASQNPEKTVKIALEVAGYLELPQSKDEQVRELTAQLDRLRQDYPVLLAAAAKRAKSRRQSALVGAKLRRSRAVPSLGHKY